MTSISTSLGRSLALALLLSSAAAGPTLAQMRPSNNLLGVTGLIDTPSGESQPDGVISLTSGHFGPFSRNTLSFQISPRLSGSFRYQAARRWNVVVPSWLSTNYMRNFDLKYQLVEESTYLPAISIGLQDFIGTGGEAAEYLVATKTFNDRLKVTAGLGWGRMASYNPIGRPFGERDNSPTAIEGGRLNYKNWFKGDVAPFGGIEYRLTDKLTLKAEYSSDLYADEAGFRKMFERKSPYNFGVEYTLSKAVRLGAYSLYGSEYGFSAQITLDPSRRMGGGASGPAPQPIGPRPSDLGWGAGQIASDATTQDLRKRLIAGLAEDGIVVESLTFTPDRVEVRMRSTSLDSRGQAVGRIARALANTMPASVENFDIIPTAESMPLSRIRINRSRLEALEHAPANDLEMFRQTEISAISGAPPAGSQPGAETFPRFNWAITPYVKPSFFDPRNPTRADLGLRFAGRYDIAPGWVVSGAITKKFGGNLGGSPVSDSALPKVRTDAPLYDRATNVGIEHLTLAWYGKPADNLYSRVTFGYLEPMFAGVSGELLWKRVDKPYALGVELNYARQRAYDQLFGLRSYGVVSGHVSGYYAFRNGYTAQLDLGRYLAGDYGGTLTLAREFENGWKVGVFATLTNVKFSDFGEGSFDKGILLTIPFGWASGGWTQKRFTEVLRPIQRDGGARLTVEGRLYDQVRAYHSPALEGQWGRFWR